MEAYDLKEAKTYIEEEEGVLYTISANFERTRKISRSNRDELAMKNPNLINTEFLRWFAIETHKLFYSYQFPPIARTHIAHKDAL